LAISIASNDGRSDGWPDPDRSHTARDEPIADHGGTVHASVGDEVIVIWPIADNAWQNARAVTCFFASERKMAAFAAEYAAEFGIARSFRAGIHAPIGAFSSPELVFSCYFPLQQGNSRALSGPSAPGSLPP
jgi:hypothetical protein